MFYRPKKKRLAAGIICAALFSAATLSVILPHIVPVPELPCIAFLAFSLSVIVMITDRYIVSDIFYVIDNGFFCAARTGRGVIFRRSSSLITGIVSVEEWKKMRKNREFEYENVFVFSDIHPKEKIVAVFRFGSNLTGVFLQGGDDLREILSSCCGLNSAG